MQERLKGNAIGLEAWRSVELTAPDGRILRVTGTPARHGPAVGERGPVTGFLVAYENTPEDLIYISGDTVWYEGVEEILRRFPGIRLAVLFLGAARIPVVDSNLTLSAEEAVRISKGLPHAQIIPVHFEGWKHFTESEEVVSRAFASEGREDRLLWLQPGVARGINLN